MSGEYYPMATLKVTAKGQVTLNKDLLRHLGIGPGDHIDVHPQPGNVVEMRPKKAGKSIESVFGILHDPNGPKLTLEEIKTAIEDGWAGRR